jgi:dipeptidyl aminopeptidase/acylaminoacyl peptidase
MPRIEWTHDSKKILISVIPSTLSLREYVRTVSSPLGSTDASDDRQPGSTVLLYESATNVSSNKTTPGPVMSNLDVYNLHDLALVEIKSRKSIPIVRNQRVDRYCLSNDDSWVVYAIPKGFEKPGSWRRVYDIVTVEVATLKRRVVVSDVLLLSEFSWSPDSTRFAYVALGRDGASYACELVVVSEGLRRGIGELQDAVSFSAPELMWDANGESLFFTDRGGLWRISVATGRVVEVARIPRRRITATIALSPGLLWTTDGGKSTVVLARDDEGKQDGFYKIDLATGDTSKLLERGQCYTCKWPVPGVGPYLTAVSGDGRYIAYIAEDAQHPPQLWVSNASFTTARQVTHFNAQFDGYKMGAVQLVDWLSEDGNRLQGVLLLPATYRSGERYPLLVWVYPALQSNYVDQFGLGEYPGPFNMQLFATHGYAVFLPDIPQQAGSPLASLAKAVLPGVSKIVSLGIADPEHIGVMGHSAGGFAALGLLVETSRFKAGVAVSGFADYTASYGQMRRDGSGHQYGSVESALGVQPWRNPVKFIQNSPVYYLDQIEAPVLIAHGSEDNAVASFLGDEVFVGLRRLGKRAEYAKYEGEGHVPRHWSYANQYDLASRVLRWLETYLKN